MTKKKLVCIMLAALTTSAAAMNMAACKQASGATDVAFEELVPEEFGEWDGNYIYRGNVKSKTTGESPEYIVSTVELDGASYSVANCESYIVCDDVIYMTLALSGRNDSCLVSYDVSQQRQKTLFSTKRTAVAEEEGLYEVYTMFYADFLLEKNRIVLTGQRTYEWGEGFYNPVIPEKYETRLERFVIDENGEIVTTDEGKYGDFMYEDCGYYYNYEDTSEGTILYAAAWGEDPVQVCNMSTESGYTKTAEFVGEGGTYGYLIETRRKKTAEEREDPLVSLEFFDMRLRETRTLLDGEKYAEWIATPKNKYLYVYDYETYEYTTKEGETDTYTAHKDAALYRFACVPAEVSSLQFPSLQEVCSFESGKKYDIEAIVEGDKSTMYARVDWCSSASGCDGGGYHDEYRQIELGYSSSYKTLKRENYREALHVARNAEYAQDGVRFGEYTYYLRYQRLSNAPIVGTSRHAYLLQRDGEKETDTLQLWSPSIVDENEKYCSMMWDENGYVMNDFVIFDK